VSDVLVVYASTHGHTAKVAGRVAETLRAEGLGTTVADVREAGGVDPARHSGVIVGASLHVGRHQAAMVDWVKEHRAALDARPSAFFSVSLTAADDTDEARATTRGCIDDFLEATGWAPARTAAVAGALQYREYSIHTRVLMRLVMRRGGHPTDTSHDYVYTDWDAVDRFARDLAGLVAPVSETAPRTR
jgi:menaquinone-dependent protoporphyrinogen oxidase